MKYVTLTRQEFYDLVWSESFLYISKKYKIAYDGIRAHCRSLDVPFPPTGYWGMKSEKKSAIEVSLPQDYSGKDEDGENSRSNTESPPKNKAPKSQKKEQTFHD